VKGAKTKTSTARNIATIAARRFGLTQDPSLRKILPTQTSSSLRAMDKMVSIRLWLYHKPN
jgi:hypothetical protein